MQGMQEQTAVALRSVMAAISELPLGAETEAAQGAPGHLTVEGVDRSAETGFSRSHADG
jgi:hypothetical protein